MIKNGKYQDRLSDVRSKSLLEIIIPPFKTVRLKSEHGNISSLIENNNKSIEENRDILSERKDCNKIMAEHDRKEKFFDGLMNIMGTLNKLNSDAEKADHASGRLIYSERQRIMEGCLAHAREKYPGTGKDSKEIFRQWNENTACQKLNGI